MADQRFPRSARLRAGREFRAMARAEERRACRAFVVLDSAAAGGGSRLGVTVSRKVGNAVVRNRVKRRIREWFRRARPCWREPRDLVVIARRPAAGMTGNAICEELQGLVGCFGGPS